LNRFQEIQLIKDAYRNEYRRHLERDMAAANSVGSSDLYRLIELLTTTARDDSRVVDHKLADADLKRLLTVNR
jgi:hypothetical protein